MQYQRARQRSYDLLQAWLSPTQLAQFKRDGTFDVVGSQGGRYRIGDGLTDEIDPHGEVTCRWCFAPIGILPRGDVLLARKIALETDEAGARAVANRVPTGTIGWVTMLDAGPMYTTARAYERIEVRRQ